MAVEVQVPKLGLTMRQGTLARWLASDGQAVTDGDALFELTTDKVQTEITAEGEGVLHWAVSEGTVLSVGAVVGWLLAPGEVPPEGTLATAAGAGSAGPAHVDDLSSSRAPAVMTPAMANGRLLASPNARRVAALKGVDLGTVAGSGPGGRIVSEDVDAAALLASTPGAVIQPASGPSGIDQTLASPLARRVALRLGADLGAVAGTGPGGRITVDDVVGASGGPRAGAVVAPEPTGSRGRAAASQYRAGDRIPMRGMRGIIAERMHASLHEMAQLTLTAEAGADAAQELRLRLRQEWEPDGLAVPGITDLVIKAAALALRHHPLLNATVAEGEILLLPDVHVGMAVALDDGLLVPVVRHADLLPLTDLAAETARLAAAARDGRLQLDELEGHTFSVTGLGAQGIDAFTPVINAPDVAILGIGRMRDTVKWEGDRPVRARVLTLSLTIDHRAVDGAPGAAFLRSVAEFLESPMRLLA